MPEDKKRDFRLKIGNLLLAVLLATVPTAITHGVLSIHGFNVCRNYEKQILIDETSEIRAKCNQIAMETTTSYIFLIGFFITLPTWLWFYLSMKSKNLK